MATIKNGTYKVFNGTDMDTINFTTVASNISIADAGGIITATDVEGALQELENEINTNNTLITSQLADMSVQTNVTGTSTAIIVTTSGNGFTYTQGRPLKFKATADNGGAATTINVDTKGVASIKKSDGSNPTFKANRVYEIYYDTTGICFFLVAKTSGNTVANHVLAGDTFSNDIDTDLVGTMPNNGAETQATAIKTLTNLVTNGNFANGTTGWTSAAAAILSATSNELSVTSTVAYGQAQQNVSLIVGHKYYYTLSMKADSTGVTSRLYDGTSYISTFASNGSGVYQSFSAIVTPANTAGQIALGIDSRSSGWTAVKIKNVVLIDLTATYGAGLESTQAQIDAIITALGGWFDGTALALGISIGSYLSNGTTGKPDILISDANLIPANIPSGKSILGVVGSATISSLGGRPYATGTTPISSSGIVTAVTGLSFAPKYLLFSMYTTASSHYAYVSKGTMEGGFTTAGLNAPDGTTYFGGISGSLSTVVSFTSSGFNSFAYPSGIMGGATTGAWACFG